MTDIRVFMSVSLDGVMEAPARPDEDTRGGFSRGGWATKYADPVMWEGMGRAGSLLFGRRTYEDFYGVWPKRSDNPFTPVLNASQKYVVSRTLEEPLPWENSTLLPGDAVAAVARAQGEARPRHHDPRQRGMDPHERCDPRSGDRCYGAIFGSRMEEV